MWFWYVVSSLHEWKGNANTLLCPALPPNGTEHLPQSNASGAGGSQTATGVRGSSSRGETPSSEAGKGPGSVNCNGGGGGNGTANTSGSKDGTVLLDCVVCQRQVSSPSLCCVAMELVLKRWLSGIDCVKSVCTTFSFVHGAVVCEEST